MRATRERLISLTRAPLFLADDLTIRWEKLEILCSSNRPMLADVNKDEYLT